jgi:hypothetical protein
MGLISPYIRFVVVFTVRFSTPNGCIIFVSISCFMSSPYQTS